MRVLILLIFAFALWHLFGGNSNDYGDPAAPGQETWVSTDSASGSFDFRGYTITPLETFSIQARVLSTHKYNSGRTAELSHLDLALGWGPMAKPEILQHFKIWQNNRWYFWRSKEMPLSSRDVISHSANMHMIPGNKAAFDALNTADKGDIIELEGYLVRADAPDGWHWVSSLSRHDKGDGSCEVVWVEKFRVL